MNKSETLIAMIVVGLFLGLCGFGCWGWPTWRVWQREMSGKAELAEAEWTRKIKIEEARAVKESATMLADAEIERAKGVAEANKIIGESLEGNEGYLRYLWIQNLNGGGNDVIYIPTEAGLPILEAGRAMKGGAE
jgi:regulator of protease activity HflC (stomatin/prohibitin superfamily)